jgi:hypothetical protein
MPNEELVHLHTMVNCSHSCVLSLLNNNIQCDMKLMHMCTRGLLTTYDVVTDVMLSSLPSRDTILDGILETKGWVLSSL